MSLVQVSRESESLPVRSASSRAATSCVALHNNGNLLPQGGWFAALVKSLWPDRQRAKMLCFLTGARSERTSRAWASGNSEPGASVLGALLRSEEGDRVLDAVMAGSRVSWWCEIRRAQIVAAEFNSARVRIDQRLPFAVD